MRKLHGRNLYLFIVDLKTVYSTRKKRWVFFPSCCISKLREEVTKAQLRIKFLPFYISTQMNIESEKEQTVSLTCVDSAVVQKLRSIFFWYSIKQLQC